MRIPELKLFSWIGKVSSGIFSVYITIGWGMEEFAMTQRIDECDIGILIWVENLDHFQRRTTGSLCVGISTLLSIFIAVMAGLGVMMSHKII